MSALEAEHGCRFLAIPSLVTVSAAWRNGIARWDGTIERFGTGGADAYGYVDALSLHVSIWDADWSQVYFGTGGVQLLARLVDSFWSSDFETIPDDELLRDAGQIEHAVQGALRDLERPFRIRPDSD
jgi:hypothetical protein